MPVAVSFFYLKNTSLNFNVKFFRMKRNESVTTSFENLIQKLIASFPGLRYMLEYNDLRSNVAKMVSLGILIGELFNNSVVSLKKETRYMLNKRFEQYV